MNDVRHYRGPFCPSTLHERGGTMNIVALAILWIFCSLAAFAQDRASDILTTGRQQLEKARTENSDSAFRQAEDTFTKALESDPDNVDAFTGRGEARNARGVIAFSKGAVGAGTALFTAA